MAVGFAERVRSPSFRRPSAESTCSRGTPPRPSAERLGNGADELLAMLARAALDPGDEATPPLRQDSCGQCCTGGCGSSTRWVRWRRASLCAGQCQAGFGP